MKKIDIEELYWVDWDELSTNPHKLNEIFQYIKDYDSRSIEELAQILRLYNNPSGQYTVEFANIVGEIYKKDKIKFIKALNLVKDEGINLVYIFRMQKVFDDEDREIAEAINSHKLSAEEIDTANTFLKMYKTICVT